MCDDFQGVKPDQMELIRKKLLANLTIPKSQFNNEFNLTYIDCVLLMAKEPISKTMLKLYQYPQICSNVKEARNVGLSARDCELKNHVFPGLHKNDFNTIVLNTYECLNPD